MQSTSTDPKIVNPKPPWRLIKTHLLISTISRVSQLRSAATSRNCGDIQTYIILLTPISVLCRDAKMVEQPQLRC